MDDITFRAVTKKDASLLTRWAETPHWQELWGNTADIVTEIMGQIDSDSVEPMIVELDGKPVAYVQTYDPHMEEDHPYQDQPFGTLGIDISIGEANDLHKGLGTQILTTLSQVLFDEGTMRLIIDPDPSNKRAIRAYEKAGFIAFDTRTSIYGPALMMALDNPEPFEDET
jgi:aminoglycoside 6'-N-acetyltransferase